MQILKCDNGLTLLIYPTSNDVATVDCWISTGSGAENPEEYGIAHFLEHMMFKGTTRFAVNELDARVSYLGGEWNAGTSKDWTHYHITLPADHVADAVDIIAEMMQNATIPQDEFDREKLVVIEEIRRKQDAPAALIFEELSHTAYKSGPYKHSTLGSIESVNAITRDMMYKFYKRFYTPDNATLVIAGDVDPDKAAQLARRHFNAWTGCKPPAVQVKTEFEIPKKTAEFSMDISENYQVLAWPIPAIEELQKLLALDLAADILSGGPHARLDHILKEETGLVGNIGCGAVIMRHPSNFYIYMVHEPKNARAAAAKATEIMTEFAKQGPTDEELRRSRRKLRNDLYFSMEETENIAELLGYWYILTNSTDCVLNYQELLDRLTADDVRQAVSEMLRHTPVNVLITGNKA